MIAKVEVQAERVDAALRRERAAKRRAGRGKLSAHLPRIEMDLASGATACPCCQAAMVVIGEDRSARLDVIPAQFRVVVTRRPKLACRACSGVVMQPLAPAPSPKCLGIPSLGAKAADAQNILPQQGMISNRLLAWTTQWEK
ncbi:IS66 family transposase zinc-finger binding domain-containing protein [Acidiphilium sp.]|uniref:IS66 family transposase zinc-finger binding domain-containing protein n=1 Tax=Acidiphilium sp. TaxID=527 RepID=UPI0038CF7AF6